MQFPAWLEQKNHYHKVTHDKIAMNLCDHTVEPLYRNIPLSQLLNFKILDE